MANSNMGLNIKISADAKAGIEAFRDLKLSVETTRDKLGQATERVKELVKAANTGKLQLLEAAQKDADGAAKKIEIAKRELEFFKRSAETGGAAGIKLFGRDIDKAKDSIAAASKELAAHNAKIEKIQATAATAIPEYARQLERAKKEAGALKDSVNAQAEALEKSRRAMAASGIDVTKLAAEQVRLNQAQKDSAAAQAQSTANMTAWATQAASGGVAIKQLAAGQADYAAKAKAASDIDQARGTIGVKAHSDIRASIDAVNQALATLKNSGTLTNAELAQATAKTKAQVSALKEEFNGVKTNADRVKGAFDLLGKAFYAFQAIMAGNALVKMIDDMTRLEGRLKLSEGSATAAGKAMAGITQIAQDAAVPIRDVADAYVRFSTSIQKMGGTQQEALGFTDALSKALKISGASAEETGGVMRQLSQAFNKGKLSGDEFVTVSESGGKVLDYLGAQLGKTRGELALMAEKGELTADKMLKLGDAGKQIDQDFKTLPVTLGDAFTRLGNSLTGFASSSTVLRGILAALAQVIQFVGERLEVIVAASLVVGLAVLVTSFGGIAAAVTALSVALVGAKVAFLALMTAHPVLLALGVAAAAVVALWDKLPEGVRKFNESPLDKIQAAIKEVDRQLAEVQGQMDANRVATEAMVTAMLAANKTLTGEVTVSMAAQKQAVEDRYQAEVDAIKVSGLSAQAKQDAELAALRVSIGAQMEVERQGLADKLALIEAEFNARKGAAERSGGTDIERANKVKQVEIDILTQKRQVLGESLASYRAHVDALNAEANRNLAEVRRIEQEKLALTQSTEERIRGLKQSAMSDAAAYADKQLQIEQDLARAREAIKAGDYERAKGYAQKATDLAASTANAVKEGDKEVISKKEAVATAVGKITEASGLVAQALDAEGNAHKSRADTATTEAGKIKAAMTGIADEVDTLTAKLSKSAKLVIETNLDEIKKKFAEFDALQAKKELLWTIRSNAEEVQKQINGLVKNTSSTHSVGSNVADVQGQISALKADTSSTHTIYVRRVETNATGGQVGAGLPGYALGGRVANSVRQFARGGRVASAAGGSDSGSAPDPAFATGGEVQGYARGGMISVGRAQDLTYMLSLSEVEPDAAAQSEMDRLWPVYFERARVQYYDNMNRASDGTLFAYERSIADWHAAIGENWQAMLKRIYAPKKSQQPSAYAHGGNVFPAMAAGIVPGSGNGDTVPRTLEAGSYVLRKSAVQKYGANGIANLIAKTRAQASGVSSRAGAAVRALLTPGEIVIPRAIAARMGSGMLDRINASRYASGGMVGMPTPAVMAGASSTHVVTINLPTASARINTASAADAAALAGILAQLNTAMRTAA